LTECILIRPYSYKCSTWINVIYVADPLELHMRITQDNIAHAHCTCALHKTIYHLTDLTPPAKKKKISPVRITWHFIWPPGHTV